jgi:hypothetical protein
MNEQVLKLIIAGALLLHGLGHGGALGALIWIARRPGTNTGGWLPARSWLFPSLATSTAGLVASSFWVLALAGFVVAATAFWGILLPGQMWRPTAIAAAVVSLLGIVLFIGTWPAFNTVAALAMDAAVLLALLWLHWPSQAMFGN